jgi:glycosyltransferase involved in cell wall biosynthesis
MKRKKLCILQRVCTSYRAPLFEEICRELVNWDIYILFGDNIPGTKVKNSNQLDDAPFFVERLGTRIISIFGRKIVYHRGLLKALRKIEPDVIISEGESHVLGYLAAITYRSFYSKNVKVIMWTLGFLPGQNRLAWSIKSLKLILYRMSDKVLLYSSYGRIALISMGLSEEKAIVAPNICDTRKHLALYEKHSCDRDNIRNRLGLNSDLEVLYIGDISKDKDLDLILEVAQDVCECDVHFTLVGDGKDLRYYLGRVQELELNNVAVVGRVDNGELYRYYIGCSVFMLPGRGGMVIGEAMCYHMPVILSEADGSEYDLIEHGIDGFRLVDNRREQFVSVIRNLAESGNDLSTMGSMARSKIQNKFNIEGSAETITKLIQELV